MKIFDIEERKKIYKDHINDPLWCDGVRTYDSGGGIILTESCVNYKGIEAFICMDEFYDFGMYINRESEESPYTDEMAIIYFDNPSEIPYQFTDVVNEMMESRKKYEGR